MKLIAFNGGMGSGKSTAIKILQEMNPGKLIVLVKFAETLYEIQEIIYSKVAPVYTRPKDFVKDRKLLQWLGTDWGRSLNENLWVLLYQAKIEAGLREYLLTNANSDDLIVVTDDCRFDNEAVAVKEMGGLVVKIERTNNEQAAQGGVGIKGHASEAGINPELVDYIVENNSTIEDFKISLDTLYREVGLFQRSAGDMSLR
jgi:hypothetical protein